MELCGSTYWLTVTLEFWFMAALGGLLWDSWYLNPIDLGGSMCQQLQVKVALNF